MLDGMAEGIEPVFDRGRAGDADLDGAVCVGMLVRKPIVDAEIVALVPEPGNEFRLFDEFAVRIHVEYGLFLRG